MHIEERKSGKNTKYYLSHSFRDDKNNPRKIRRYLGFNLPKKDLERLKKRAEQLISQQINEEKTDIFLFSLSKKEINKLNKFNKEIKITHLSKKQWELFTEEFVYNTNAIEGSRISQKEVHDILESSNKNLNNKSSDEIETKNVAEAVKFIRETKEDFSLNFLLKLHKICFNGTKSFAGKFRNVEVGIYNSYGEIIHRGTPVKNLNNALKEYINWYEKNKKKFEPLVLAAIMHNQFEHIHPFQDGNGRIGRLILNYFLIKKKHPPINILLEDRMEYYQTLQAYHKELDLEPSLRFLIRQYKKTLKLTSRKASN